MFLALGARAKQRE